MRASTMPKPLSLTCDEVAALYAAIDFDEHGPALGRLGERVVEAAQSTPPDDAITLNVQHCARCGGDHDGLQALPLARPIDTPEAGGVLWSHWSPCPTNGEPILLSTHHLPGSILTPEVVEDLKHYADVADCEGQLSPDNPGAVWLMSRGWRRDN